MSDKMSRAQKLARVGTQKVSDESLCDTLKDLAVYAVLAIILIEEERDAELSALRRTK